MTKRAFLSIVLLLCALSTSALQQRHQMPTPPDSMNPDNAKPVTQDATLPRHLDLVEMQREADDLARAAQTIPGDVASIRRGVLPKDVIQKLKQIEKLSKRLRNELNP